jgi:hypothetical protein
MTDEPVERKRIEFKPDTDRIELDLFLDMMDGNQRALVQVMATCMVDEKGEYIPPDEARKVLGHLSIKQFRRVSDEFGNALRDYVIPPVSAAS